LILEGLPAIVGGLIAYFQLPSSPTEAGFLSAQEKDWIVTALTEEKSQKIGEHQLSAFRALAHHRLWHLACISFTWQTSAYAIYFWMPQAMKSLFNLYPNTLVGILVIIPFVAGLFAMILASRSSDRKLERRYHMAIPLIAAGTA